MCFDDAALTKVVQAEWGEQAAAVSSEAASCASKWHDADQSMMWSQNWRLLKSWHDNYVPINEHSTSNDWLTASYRCNMLELATKEHIYIPSTIKELINTHMSDSAGNGFELTHAANQKLVITNSTRTNTPSRLQPQSRPNKARLATLVHKPPQIK